ncbi:hypothetical protein K431DRAFT_54004 [Polychaeton citri CBS 116435]|uniref:F-box domain-containing protein n=1 Tax=Polychaeton citri CBS 116435 TaxID=1314669 RepID=A0A9P4QHG3_9PEZI|nr:hypothetical protein K431DRAFT_54004 [Polychaeton citri CBS 116435]
MKNTRDTGNMDSSVSTSPAPPMSSAGTSSFRLLDLPAELRALIFSFALTSPRPLVTFRLDPYQKDSYTEAWPPPSLTFVSKQFREESLPIFYQCNDFVLHTEGLEPGGNGWQRKCDGKAGEARIWLRRMDAATPCELWQDEEGDGAGDDLGSEKYSLLRKARGFTFWIRYVSSQLYTSGHRQGLLALCLRWRRSGHVGGIGTWEVCDADGGRGWKWMTVVRRPDDVEADGRWLAWKLQSLVQGKGRGDLGWEELVDVMTDLVEAYVGRKGG